MAKFKPGESGNPRCRPKGRTLANELRRAVKPRFAEIVGAPGKTGAELPEILSEKYGDRLATIDGMEVRV